MSGFSKKFMHSAAESAGSFCARREFLKAMLVAPFVLPQALTSSFELRLGIVYDDASHAALNGARMSVNESERAAALLGAMLSSVELQAADADAVARWISGNRLAAVIAACQAPTLARVLPAFERLQVVAINCAAAPDAVSGLCRTQVRSILPPASQARSLVVWDSTLEKFGAAQLNARYEAAYHAPMPPLAWCGWFAVKALWESSARAGSGTAHALEQFLESARAEFDGHKGTMLRFDGHRVLRQPLYRVSTINAQKQVKEMAPAEHTEYSCV